MSQNPAPPPGRSSSEGSTTLVIAALIFALIAVVLVNLYIQSIKSGNRENTFAVFRLRIAKQAGDKLVRDDVELLNVPDRFEESFSDIVDENPDFPGNPLRIGDTFGRDVEPYEVLTQSMFENKQADATRFLIHPGMRGVALPVVAQRLPDPLKAEMRVDLLAPMRVGGSTRQIVVVMENVRVVSVGNTNIEMERVIDGRGRGQGDNFETLTIEVKPEQAVQLHAISQEVQKTGSFSVLLRAPEDNKPFEILDGGINPVVLESLGIARPGRE